MGWQINQEGKQEFVLETATNATINETVNQAERVDVYSSDLYNGIAQSGTANLVTAYSDSLDILKSKMNYKESLQTQDTVWYGKKFENSLSEKERNKLILTKGSELAEKAYASDMVEKVTEKYGEVVDKRLDEALAGYKNRSLPGASAVLLEEAKHFISADKQHNSKLLDLLYGIDWANRENKAFRFFDMLVTDFINIDFSTLDFSSDRAFAKSSMVMEGIINKKRALGKLLENEPTYYAGLNEEAKVLLVRKSEEILLLENYYLEYKRLLGNKYYVTHLNSEMSANAEINYTDEKKMQVALFIQGREQGRLALEGYRKGQLEAQVFELIGDSHKKAVAREQIALGIHETRKSKSRGFSFLDMFGRPLQFISWIMRDTRTDNHGRKRLKELEPMIDKLPKCLEHLGDEGDAGSYIKKKEGTDITGGVDLGKYFKDKFKSTIPDVVAGIELSRKQHSEADATFLTEEEEDEWASYLPFLEHMKAYSKIRGIVNSDTTELEMALIEQIKYELPGVIESITKYNAQREKETSVIPYYIQLQELCEYADDVINKTYKGRLREVEEKEGKATEYQYIIDNSKAIVEDNSYFGDMEESNIKDIPLFTHYPNINDIKQSTIGDCYLVAAMTSYVHANPESILNMFEDLGNGDVMVKLYECFDGQDKVITDPNAWKDVRNTKPVYVKLRKHYETGDGNNNDCVWPQLLEKAFSACGFNGGGVSYVDEKGHLFNSVAELTNGMSNSALMHLTGNIIPVNKRYSPLKHTVQGQASNIYYEDCWDLVITPLFAGLPRFVRDDVEDFINGRESQAEIASITMEAYNSIEIHFRAITAALTDIKKKCVKLGWNDAYQNIITKMASILDMEMVDNWDAVTECMEPYGDTHTLEKYDPDTMHMAWSGWFKMDDILKRTKDRFHNNANELRHGRTPQADEEHLLDCLAFNRDEFIHGFLPELVGILDKEGVTKEEVIAFWEDKVSTIDFGSKDAQYKKAIVDDAQNEYNGIQTGIAQKDRPAVKAMMMEAMDFFGYKQYSLEIRAFLGKCQDALRNKGSVSFSIPHFVSLIDIKEVKSETYLLIKDPFNVYNRQYEASTVNVNGQARQVLDTSKTKSEDFEEVFDLVDYHYKRHLSEDENKNVAAGFKGLSWWRLQDIYPMIKHYSIIKDC